MSSASEPSRGLVSGWLGDGVSKWDEFWFSTRDPRTLCLIRILAGAMLFYTHLVWSLDLMAFLGPDAWISSEVSREIASGQNRYGWTPLWSISSPGAIWTFHLVGLVAIFMFTIGMFTRVTAVLAWMFAVAYCQRLQGTLFGLDQVNTMLTLYLMFAPCGAVYSVDHWLRRRSGNERVIATVGANLTTRCIQLHMCVIYFFGGIHKITGGDWRNGHAMWFSIANHEYQSIDLTWMGQGGWPYVLGLLTHLTVAWEISYAALVWPRFTRPIVLGIGLMVHLGIALFLGMITFGVAMIIGNLAFISPQLVKRVSRQEP